jgi:serine/threonine protein kinase
MKIQKSAQHYTEAAYDEIELLAEGSQHAHDMKWVESLPSYPFREVNEDGSSSGGDGEDLGDSTKGEKKEKLRKFAGPLQGYTGVVSLVDYFEHAGPNGTHVCMVFEVMGPNVLALIKQFEFKGVPENYVRKVAAHTLIGLDYLHRCCGIIHTDLKPENVLVGCPWNVPIDKQGFALIDPIHQTSLVGPTGERVLPQGSPKKKDAPPSKSLAGTKDGLSRKERRKLKRKQGKQKRADVTPEEDRTPKERDSPTCSEEPAAVPPPSQPPPRPMNAPPYMKPMLKPSRSDPTLLNSYGDMLSCWKAPYHYMQPPPQDTPTLRLPAASGPNEYCYRPAANAGHAVPSRADAKRLMTEGINPFTWENCEFKLADLGNACWLNRHFAEEIQTRQYRSPEVILGAGYSCSADLWSLACMCFELITGDYLFDPKTAEEYSRDEDHLALCMELLGEMPEKVLARSRQRRTFFNLRGELRHIKKSTMRFWSLENVLKQKYKQHPVTARTFASFLLPILELDPDLRPIAQDHLKHPWLRGLPSDDCNELQLHPTASARFLYGDIGGVGVGDLSARWDGARPPLSPVQIGSLPNEEVRASLNAAAHGTQETVTVKPEDIVPELDLKADKDEDQPAQPR